MEIYHQLGYRYKWNLQSLADDATGDGVIIGPRHMKQEVVEKLPASVRAQAIFDPQFFLPGTPLGSLLDYGFFPAVLAGGFDTTGYETATAKASADSCVDFQLHNNFRYVIIPTRYCDGTPSSFVAQQTEFTVQPFLEAISVRQPNKPVLLQLILNSTMLKDTAFTDQLLNWVTGIDELNGVYIIVQDNRNSKQIKDPMHLLNLLGIVHALRCNELEVVLGYLNTEALVLSLADPNVVTIGSYERTRMFNSTNFSDDDTGGGPPNARLYFRKLLQWIEHPYVGALQAVPALAPLFDHNHYNAAMFVPTYKWHFSKPELYKHYFLEMTEQLRHVGQVHGKARYERLSTMITEASLWYTTLKEAGIVLENTENDGSHLPAWQTAANLFAKKMGW